MDIAYIYLRNHESYDKYDCYKLGKTLNIPDRENQYITGEIKRGEFISVYEVKKNEVDKIERDLKSFFYELNIYEGGGTEFFKKSIINNIQKYFDNKDIWYKKLDKNEIDKLSRTSREKNNYTNDRMDIVNKKYYSSIIKEKKPYSYQQNIINKTIEYFDKNNKGILVLSCGMGKTLISLWISQKLNHNSILIGVPNIELLEQWDTDIKNEFCEHKILKIYNGIKNNVIQEIKKHTKIIILTTYASSYKVKKNFEDIIFDIKICDETHHLTSFNMNDDEDTKNFVEFLKINSKKQLALTATMKDIENINNDNKIVSNTSEKYFGKIILKKSLLWAIKNNIVCDYQVQTLIFNKDEISKYLDEFEIKTKNEINFFLSAFSALESIYNSSTHHILIYSNNKENSVKIITYIKKLVEKKFFNIDEIYYSNYNSEMKKIERFEILNNYNKSKNGIISTIYCLGEGYNSVIIDGVLFSENMSSNIRIVQSAMRANRKNKNIPNKISKIILPILNNENWINDNDDFKKIREIIYQLGMEDETIEHKIKAFGIKIKKHQNVNNVNNENNVNNDNNLIELDDDVMKKIFVKMIDRVKLGITYEKAKKIIAENKINSRTDYEKLCDKNILLHRNPEEFFKDEFKGWIDYFGIQRIYYEFDECVEKINIYMKKINIVDTYDNDKICYELCKLDSKFPPNGLWIEYYSNNKINNLNDIIKNNITKKKKYSTII